MMSDLVCMAPVFSKQHLKGGELVAIKLMSKKGNVMLEGTGTVRYNYGEPTLTVDLTNGEFVVIKAKNIMNGTASLKILKEGVNPHA